MHVERISTEAARESVIDSAPSPAPAPEPAEGFDFGLLALLLGLLVVVSLSNVWLRRRAARTQSDAKASSASE